MTVKQHRADRLLERYEKLERQIREAPFPRLRVVIVDDDGEQYQALRCPRCGGLAEEENLASVDRSTRWNYADYPDDSAFDHREITFHGDNDSDFDSTLYYLHNDSHAVRLPLGWTEDWT